MEITKSQLKRVRDVAPHSFVVVRPMPKDGLHFEAICTKQRDADRILQRVLAAQGARSGWVVVQT